MKSALITGMAGFVGRHMRRVLMDRGWSVTGLDVAEADLPGCFRCDCRDYFAERDMRWDLVIHCAAVVGGRLTISNDPLAVAVDLELDAAMFRWAVRTRQPRVVYFSSSAAYPTHLQATPGRRLVEDDIDLDHLHGTPDMSYGWSKLTGELLASYAEAEGVAVHVFRPFSGYGSDQDDSYPFPAYIARAQRRDDPFAVWSDGTHTRDFVHIDDIVECVLTAVEEDYRLPVNIGTGVATSFNQLAAMVYRAANYQPLVLHDLSKPTGPSHRVADTRRLHDLYVPKIDLETGIAMAMRERAAA